MTELRYRKWGEGEFSSAMFFDDEDFAIAALAQMLWYGGLHVMRRLPDGEWEDYDGSD